MNGAEEDTGASIVQALETIYNPQSTNETRRNATIFLENAKTQPEAPAFGHSLASNINHNAIVRHYGLSLLDFTIRHRWDDYSEQQKDTLRGWIVQFAQNVSEGELKFFRNKIGQLWVEITKRSWPTEWKDMDKFLMGLWSMSAVHQELVLHILETLSDEVFAKEEFTTGPRGTDLGKACTEIFTSTAVLAEAFPNREFDLDHRHGVEGWLQRLLTALVWRLDSGLTSPEAKNNVQDILTVLRSVMSWIMPDAVVKSSCIELICRCLTLPEKSLQLAAIETLHAVYHRTALREQDVVDLACPMLRQDALSLLQQLYITSQVDANDIDDITYLLLKRLSETLCALGLFLYQRPRTVYGNCDVPQLFALLIEVLQHPSLVVSVPILYLWTRLLATQGAQYSSELTQHIATLLDVCSQRLIRYEALPEDSQDITFLFLNEDFDTMPERHAFVGNYRRFCTEAVEHVISKAPLEAMPYVISQAESAFSTLYTDAPPFSKTAYSSTSPAILRADAQSTTLVTAVRGYLNWRYSSDGKKAENIRGQEAIHDALEQLCHKLIKAHFEDPIIQKRILQLVVELAKIAFANQPAVTISICEQIFNHSRTVEQSATPYGEAMRDLQASRPRELQKLTYRFPDAFMSVYPALENGVQMVMQTEGLDHRVKLEYQAFLFVINQRTTELEDGLKYTRLQSIVQPVLEEWRDPSLGAQLTSFASFRALLALDRFPDYCLNREAWKIEEWSKVPLDAAGQDLRNEISLRSDKLPLLATRTLLSASTDKVRTGSNPHLVAKSVWREGVSTIVPQLLQMTSHAHAFSNPERWTDFPDEMKIIIQRTLVDRVWQSGISTETRDDFYAKVRDSKSTLEGLASTVRGAVRNVRELSYWILHCLTNFGDAFYGHMDLPDPLANALYTDAHALSPHQFSALLKLSGALIDGCPPELRVQFLTPLLFGLFKQLDRKLSSEWEGVQNRSTKDVSEEVLDQEMKADSVLRQLTHSALLLICTLVEFPKSSSGATTPPTPTFRTIILSTPSVLESLLLFLSHALRMSDHRSSGLVTRLLRLLIPEFAYNRTRASSPKRSKFDDSPVSPGSKPTAASSVDSNTATQVRAFLATDTLRAAITSLNDAYFVDMQKELALLIASILIVCQPPPAPHALGGGGGDVDEIDAPRQGEEEDIPRSILLTLPTLSPRKVDSHLRYIRAVQQPQPSERQQRASVLALLEGVRGVGIHEAGRIGGGAGVGVGGLVNGHGGGVDGSSQRARSRVLGGGGGGGRGGFGEGKGDAGSMQLDDDVESGGPGPGRVIVRGGSPEGGTLEDLFG